MLSVCMEMDMYQSKSAETAVYPDSLKGGVFYASLGLAGEVGELLNKIKKIARDGAVPDKEGITLELGDILWYVSAVASEMGIKMDDVAGANLEKLSRRKANGTLHGSGDNR